jgi:hypothetical protein
MTEGRLEPKLCSFCGKPEPNHPVLRAVIPMFTSAYASICLNCVRKFYRPAGEFTKALEQARVLGYPRSRWRGAH